MVPVLASIFFGIGILYLFVLDGRKKGRVSKALWIPTIWLFFCCSRSLTEWVGANEAANRALVYSDGSPVDRALFIILEIAALAVVANRFRLVGPILCRNWAICLFFLYAIISMFWSDYPFVTFKHWIKGIGDLLMILIVLTEPDVRDAISHLAVRIGFILVPLSLLFIRYLPELGRTYSPGGTPEPIGVATQKNSLGVLCDCIGIALIWYFRSIYNNRRHRKRTGRLLAVGAVLAMIVWLLHLCNSVTSIGALAMASGVMLISNRPLFRRRPAMVHLMVAVVLAGTLYALFFQSSGTLIESVGRNSTLTGRTTVWPQLINLVDDRFIGVGYESFWLGPRLEKVWVITQGLRINEAHNGYVELLLTLGWLGECVFGVLLVVGYRNVIAAYRRDADTGGLRIAWFLAALITGLTEAAFRMMNPTWIVFLLATIASPWDVLVEGRGYTPPVDRPQLINEESARVLT